jgi:hypothetical protein
VSPNSSPTKARSAASSSEDRASSSEQQPTNRRTQLDTTDQTHRKNIANQKRQQLLSQFRGITERNALYECFCRDGSWEEIRPLLMDLIRAKACSAADLFHISEWPIATDSELLLAMLASDEDSGLPNIARQATAKVNDPQDSVLSAAG